MVSFSDEGGGQGRGRGRSFSGVGKTVAGNKEAYAARMGYVFVDAGGMVDHSRPPSWSKILAVRSQLPNYDWVFWNDAVSLSLSRRELSSGFAVSHSLSQLCCRELSGGFRFLDFRTRW